jgi:protein-tyrosine kinase
LGKIFNALEKYLQENPEASEEIPLQEQDFETLLQYNQHTGILNIKSREVVKDPSTVQRLLANRLIRPDGKVTAHGKEKYDELIYQRRVAFAGQVEKEAENAGRQVVDAEEPDALRALDRDALMAYDRETGHLLKHDSKTGQLEEQSLGVLHQSGVLQRLLSNELITPEGKLTLKGIQECHRMEEQQSGAPNSGVSVLPIDSSDSPADLDSVKAEEQTKTSLTAVFAAQKRFTRGTEASASPEAFVATDGSAVAVKSVAEVSAIDPNLVSLLAPESFMAERFKILRTNLLFPVTGASPRSILISSVNPGDGKSFVAANLAVSVAMNINRHVLLMDCDLRKPTIHTAFGFRGCAGLSDYLSKRASLPSLLLKTKIDRLSILPAGMPPINPSELLSSDRMAALMEEVTNRYKDRLIVIDSPPPSLTSEAGVLARMTDSILLVVRHMNTNREEIKVWISQLGKEKIIGAVLNQFDHPLLSAKGYRYYRKYGDYAY